MEDPDFFGRCPFERLTAPLWSTVTAVDGITASLARRLTVHAVTVCKFQEMTLCRDTIVKYLESFCYERVHQVVTEDMQPSTEYKSLIVCAGNPTVVDAGR